MSAEEVLIGEAVQSAPTSGAHHALFLRQCIVECYRRTNERYKPAIDLSETNVERRAVFKLPRAQSGINASVDFLSRMLLTD